MVATSRISVVLVVAACCLSGLRAAEPGNAFVGSEACRVCHEAEFSQQSVSSHARSLHRAADHPLAASFATDKPLRREPEYDFVFLQTPDGPHVRAEGGGDAMDMSLDWAFGAGEQGVTFVTRANQEWYLEHSFSYFAGPGSFAHTPGHEGSAQTLPHAVGILYKIDKPDSGILQCFGCHSTGPVALGAGRAIFPRELGVRCESCHGPGGNHVEAMQRGDSERGLAAIVNPGRLSAKALGTACGACHRPPEPVNAVDWTDPWNTRHSPPYLVQSRCFQQSADRLSCLTCHEPHGPLRSNEPSYYAAKCSECHETPRHPDVNFANAAPADCTACHMPKVEPHPYLQFTNHWIGVYRDGEPLKPVR